MHLKITTSLMLAGMLAFSVGCNSKAPAENATEATDASGHGHTHKHDGWWCDEHGVPEEICALCNTKLVADFKTKGDWCAQHERPDSQCFTCHPELEQKFAAQYEAKFGKKPPKPE